MPAPNWDRRVQRFWARVRKSGTNGCWLWTGAKCNGYGYVQVNGQHIKAHRFAFTLANGQLRTSERVRHTCDNPPCVRPSHLRRGSQADNVADRDARGRRRPPVGELNPAAKLTWAKVAKIRNRYRSGETQVHLATAYGVHQGMISRIVLRKAWVNVTQKDTEAG